LVFSLLNYKDDARSHKHKFQTKFVDMKETRVLCPVF